jgi:hypothetical protein
MTWMENSFFDHLDKFSNSLGFENYEIAIPLSMSPWRSPAERDSFIMAITGEEVKGGGPSTFKVGEVE